MAVAAAPLRYTAPGSSEMNSPSVSNVSPQTSQSSGSTVTLQMLANQQYQPYYLRPAYRFKTNTPQTPIDLMADGPGRRLRKNVANVRRHIDYIANVLNYVEARLWQSGIRDREALQPDILYQNCVLPASATLEKPVDCILTKFVRAAMNKVKCPIYSVCWTPEGKRLITGASTGEFTLWNGTAFNFETILQAHDSAIRALKWSHNDQWLVSADHDGFVKYWQPNMNNVHMYQAHKDEPVRSISFAPTDAKIVTGSDDGTARIWDFAKCAEEKVLRGHGSDVRSVDWHPQKGLICTGSRDSQQPVKLWDPKSGLCLATLHEHKNSVMAVQWNKNGNWLLTGSKDHLIKMYDIRMMREMYTYRGHKKEVTALAWHPVHESLFVSSGGDGSLAYWLVNNEKELGFLEHAHDQAVWTLEWHPLGHILASGSNDNNTKFWSRNRPGDTQEDIFGLASFSGNASHTTTKESKADTDEEIVTKPVIPGMGLDDDVFQELEKKETQQIIGGPSTGTGALGGPLLMPEDPNARMQSANIGAKRTLIKQPPPKKAQRQFERMWNVAKPTGGDDFDEEMPEEGSFRKTKTSLLGPPPPSMLSASKGLEGQRSFSPQPLSYKGDHSNAQSSMHSTSSQRVSSSNSELGINIVDAQQQQQKAQSTSLLGLAQLRLPSSSPNQPWASPSQAAAAAAAAALIQQVNGQNTLTHTQPVIQQEAIAAPFSVAPIASLPFPQAAAVGSQLIWPPLIQPQPQNLDIDYRTGGATPSLVIPSVVAPGTTGTDDVDLRNQQASSSSSSWRTPASTSSDTHMHSSRDAESDTIGSSKIHDPRMRRGSNRNSTMSQLDRDSDGLLNTGKSLLGPPPLQMRDPRRKPQSQTSQKLDSDYESRYEGHKAPSRTWMPTMSDSGGQPYNGPRSTGSESSSSSRNKGYGGGSSSSGSRGNYDDYDGRGSYSKQYGSSGGGQMRRGALIDRGRGRDRSSRRQAY